MTSCATRFKYECDEPCEWKLGRKYGNARRKPGKCIYSGYDSSSCYSSNGCQGTEDCHTTKDSCRGGCKWIPDAARSNGGTCVYRQGGKDSTTRLCGAVQGTPFVPIADLLQYTIKRGGLPGPNESCLKLANGLLRGDVTLTIDNIAEYGRECLKAEVADGKTIDEVLTKILVGIFKNMKATNVTGTGDAAVVQQEFVDRLQSIFNKEGVLKQLLEAVKKNKFPEVVKKEAVAAAEVKAKTDAETEADTNVDMSILENDLTLGQTSIKKEQTPSLFSNIGTGIYKAASTLADGARNLFSSSNNQQQPITYDFSNLLLKAKTEETSFGQNGQNLSLLSSSNQQPVNNNNNLEQLTSNFSSNNINNNNLETPSSNFSSNYAPPEETSKSPLTMSLLSNQLYLQWTTPEIKSKNHKDSRDSFESIYNRLLKL